MSTRSWIHHLLWWCSTSGWFSTGNPRSQSHLLQEYLEVFWTGDSNSFPISNWVFQHNLWFRLFTVRTQPTRSADLPECFFCCWPSTTYCDHKSWSLVGDWEHKIKMFRCSFGLVRCFISRPTSATWDLWWNWGEDSKWPSTRCHYMVIRMDQLLPSVSSCHPASDYCSSECDPWWPFHWAVCSIPPYLRKRDQFEHSLHQSPSTRSKASSDCATQFSQLSWWCNPLTSADATNAIRACKCTYYGLVYEPSNIVVMSCTFVHKFRSLVSFVVPSFPVTLPELSNGNRATCMQQKKQKKTRKVVGSTSPKSHLQNYVRTSSWPFKHAHKPIKEGKSYSLCRSSLYCLLMVHNVLYVKVKG